MRPPSYKPKLPRSLSFPIGYEALNDSLKGVPVFDEIRLIFFNGASIRGSEFRGIIESKAPYRILQAEFSKWDKRLGVQLMPDGERGHWSLWVYPVERSLKSIARASLASHGIPGLIDWFSAARRPSWYHGTKRCDVIFDPGTGEVRIEHVDEKP